MTKLHPFNSGHIFSWKETLYWIGLLLSGNHDDSSIDQIEQDILRGRVNWPVFFSICDQNWILPSVFRVFRDHNLLEIIPDELSGHLTLVYQLNLKRNYRILQQINHLVELLNKNGIEPIFLKGSGNLIDKLYADFGERFIGDIDILVDNDNFLKAARVLEQDGYIARSPFNSDALDGMKHYPRLYKNSMVADVEIHRLLANPPYDRFFNYRLIDTKKKRPALIPEGCFVLDVSHRIVHNFIHSQLNDRAYFRANPSLRQMFDLVLLSNLTSAEAAFKEFAHYQSRARSYLFLVRSVFNIPHPPMSKFDIMLRFYRARYLQTIHSEKLFKRIMAVDKSLQPIRYYGRNTVRILIEKSYRERHLNRLYRVLRSG